MFPLEVAMLPGEELPLRIFEPRYAALVQACLAADDPAFGVVLIAAGREVGGGDSRSDIGALAHITEYDNVNKIAGIEIERIGNVNTGDTLGIRRNSGIIGRLTIGMIESFLENSPKIFPK